MSVKLHLMFRKEGSTPALIAALLYVTLEDGWVGCMTISLLFSRQVSYIDIVSDLTSGGAQKQLTTTFRP